METSSLRKAAIVLIGLGPKLSGELLKRLPETLVERLTSEIAGLRRVDPVERAEVFAELERFRTEAAATPQGGASFAKQMLEEAVGAHRASKLISQATGFADDARFEVLKRADPVAVANFLKVEAPQTVAMILAHVDPRHAGPILAALPDSMHAEVTYRMAILERPHPDIVKTVEECLGKEIKADYEEGGRAYGGPQQVAELLNQVDQQMWTDILDEMREIHEETASVVKSLMFVFEDIVTLDDRHVQDLLKEIDSRELTYALKAATDEVKQKIFANMSKRAAAGIQEDMEYLGPVRLSEVAEAQQRIIDTIRRLERDGVIVLGGGPHGGDLVL